MEKLKEFGARAKAWFGDHKKGSIITGIVVLLFAVNLAGGLVLQTDAYGVPTLIGGTKKAEEPSEKEEPAESNKEKENVSETGTKKEQPTETAETETASDEEDMNASEDAEQADSGETTVETSDNTNTASSSRKSDAKTEKSSKKETAKAGADNSGASAAKNNQKSQTSGTKQSGTSKPVQPSAPSTPKQTTPSNPTPTPKQTQPAQPSKPAQPAQPAKPSGHYETVYDQVLVQAAYDEPIYQNQLVGVKCNGCGQQFSNMDDFEKHCEEMDNAGQTIHGGWTGVWGKVQTGTKHHDAVYKSVPRQVWVQD